MSNSALNTPLSDDEYDALEALLAAPELGGRAMDVSMLEGFLTAVAIGPNLVSPSQWLPWVADMRAGVAGMAFADAGDAGRAIGLVTRHYNYMVQWLTQDPASFEPIYVCGPEWGAAEWCQGFLLGMQMDIDAWTPLPASEAEWFAPFTCLGTEDGQKLLETHGDAEHWMNQVIPSVIKINAFWMARRPTAPAGAAQQGGPGSRPVVRATPKVGRNDPCPCGSGKKYKKCCAVAEGASE